MWRYTWGHTQRHVGYVGPPEFSVQILALCTWLWTLGKGLASRSLGLRVSAWVLPGLVWDEEAAPAELVSSSTLGLRCTPTVPDAARAVPQDSGQACLWALPSLVRPFSEELAFSPVTRPR